MRRVQASTGFTLIEMAVTMAIFAILVALTVPSMRTWMANARVRSVADALQNGIRLAQAESLRRSRQVVFALTNNSAPQAGTFTAADNGSYWAIMTVPAMTDGSEANAASRFVQSGVLSTTVQVTGPGAICFNSVGRLVANNAPGVTGATCTAPTSTPRAGAPPMDVYNVTVTNADHPLQVQVSLGGQVHMCDPSQTLSSTNPYGC
jgi:type IV fimbrial biogenesis protein FimT